MPDQQDMQTYVRGRLAGTQGPPQPTPDPMQSYVLAQGARGSRVPRDTMPDSPRYLEDLDVAPGPRPQSDEDQALDAVFAQKQQLKNQIDMAEQQMKQLPLGSPERDQAYDQWVGMIKQYGQMNDQFKNTQPGAWSQRLVGVDQNRGPDVDVIQNAIQNRQAQPRQPLPPPAPGGVPYAPTPAPVIPQPPATAGLTS
jgi:hypothetical protein